MTITMSSVLMESPSGAFLRPPHRLRGRPGCGRWLMEITRAERPRTDMRQRGRRPCRHSLRAGTERRDRISYGKPRPKVQASANVIRSDLTQVCSTNRRGKCTTYRAVCGKSATLLDNADRVGTKQATEC